MKNKLNVTFNISNFEPISEDSENKLVGGFSLSQSSSGGFGIASANNCDGGNCYEGCGKGQNIGCNEVAGCGAPKE